MALGWVAIATSVLVLLMWVLLRQRPGLGTISNTVVVGLVVNLALDALSTPDSLVVGTRSVSRAR